MGGFRGKAVLLALVLGVEVVRELYLLKKLGFQPGRFVEWLRGDLDGAW